MPTDIHSATPPRPRLSLGPLLYYWPREQVLDFYAEMIETPVEVIYLGETICSKRRLLRPEDWWDLAERVAASGREPVISTLALIESEGELKTLERQCADRRFLIEANDLAALDFLEGRPFVTGPSINLYNQRTLSFLAARGLKRWVLPVELGRATAIELLRVRPAGVECEVFAFGRLPLAYSARCFTAYNNGQGKDQCEFRCGEHPDGLLITTQEGQPFLALNGIQTQSAAAHSLLASLDDVTALGIDLLRISPQSHDTAEIVRTYAACLSGDLSTANGLVRLRDLAPGGLVDGYWTGAAGIAATGALTGV
ncbi:ubiquinone anaerobic biosynthesis protein UbiV [Lamprocystis purpurea]|jgi:collagenase-like PrtC family protease|uniref:ubiquinone anaerobic biosynthesis protein UbiV n=1 Tax=Lamprocystis purpurea TaxID=61598 RepID=UPI00035D3934|nr:U32 family peptidase [Lamprocystis purpurea]